MDPQLLETVEQRLDSDTSMDTEVGLLVLAACESDDALSAALGGQEPRHQPTESAFENPGEPRRAYLASIVVEGFRGIGPKTELEVPVGPGLTLVVGRNGSGKSSFVEALEVLLTGDSRRWSNRNSEKVWRDGWRNLHQQQDAMVSAHFALDDATEPMSVTRSWTPNGDLSAADAVVQIRGEKQSNLTSLGWDTALSSYRPILSYNELGSILDETPTKQYEALAGILGLDDLTEAVERLTKTRLSLKKTSEIPKAEVPRLIADLREVDDDRARACLKALGQRTWGLETIVATVTGTAGRPVASDNELLRGFANLAGPDPTLVITAIERARRAADLSDEVSGSESEAASRIADLMQAGLDYHDHAGDVECPLCRVGRLDDKWVEATTAEIERLRRVARDALRAHQAVEDARERLGSLLPRPSSPLPEAIRIGLPAEPLRELWQEWSDLPTTDLRAWAERIEHLSAKLLLAVGDVRDAAALALTQREDRWAPLAQRLSVWAQKASEANNSRVLSTKVESAERWLKAAMGDLRDDRLRPIAAQAAAIWSELSQHSNVELGPIKLSGSGNQRRVSFDVKVDGVESVALSVMSQGELHALALAIFLPRVTLPQSPFRFLVIDDPVQAMDAAKVEGLARLLETTAKDRQVIVFTHDDRLPQAIRYLGIDTTIVRVNRRSNSVVELSAGGDPASIHLDDALALALTDDLPEEVRRVVVPGYCRLAIESVLNDVVRRKLLRSGTPHSEVEDRLSDVTTLTTRAALALFQDTSRGGEVLSRLGAYGRWAQDTYQAANRGSHEAYQHDLLALVHDARRLVEKLREMP